MPRKPLIYAADFETNNDPNDCRVWAWGAVEVTHKLKPKDDIIKGRNLRNYMEWMFSSSKIIYFHNLKFDATFIMSDLLKRKWEHFKGDNPKDMDNRQFYTLINDMGIIYKIIMKVRNRTIELRDSYKLLAYKLDDIGKFLSMDIEKGHIDYDAPRPLGYEPTADEWEYLRKDVVILALAIQSLFGSGVKKLTMSSQTLANYKKHLANEKLDFDRFFPTLDQEEYDDIIGGYVGGLVYVNPNHQNEVVENVKVYDVNSMYPSKLSYEYMPMGKGRRFEGKYDGSDTLYIVTFTCTFKIKEGMHPWVRIKNNPLYKANKCALMSLIAPVKLTMCNVDLENFKLHYDVKFMEWHGGYSYTASNQLFQGYIAVNNQKKVEHDDNPFQRNLYKLYNNGLYGKFGMKKVMSLKEPYLDTEEGHLRYRIYKTEENDGVYLPVAIFTTAYARDELLRPMRELGDDFIYCDTDSIHCFNSCPHIDANTHHTDLGKWDNEFNATHAKYLGAKLYMLDGIDGKGKHKIKITGAGMTPEVKAQVTFENFCIGSEFQGAKKSRNVKGGVCILPMTYRIYERGIR